MSDDDLRPWGILAGLFLLSAGFVACVIAPSTVLPLFTADFTIEKPAAGASISAVFLTWALLQIPGGYVVDRHDNRRRILFGAVVFLGAGAVGLLPTRYRAFLLTRLVSGASVVFVFVGSLNVLRRVLPADASTQGTSLSVLATSSQVGNLVAPVAGGWPIAHVSWTAGFGFGFVASLAAVGLVTILLVPPAT